MKKIFKALGLVCLTTVLLTFTSCKKQEKLILGTWNLTTIAADAMTIDASTYANVKVTFNSDNTFGMNITPSDNYIALILGGLQPGTPEYEQAIAEMQAGLAVINAAKGTYALGDNKLTLTMDNKPVNADIQTLEKKSLVISSTEIGDLMTVNTPTAKDGTAATKLTLTFSK